jgi:archaellum biogenesis protein FlaJ (TadC family)
VLNNGGHKLSLNDAITFSFHPPETLLQLIKALLDSLTVFAFLILLLVIIYAKNRYPVIERRKTFVPLISFAILGTISTFMDAVDEWIWFSPKEFYDQLWKPTRLFLFLGAIFLLIYAFYQFYLFSERIFAE